MFICTARRICHCHIGLQLFVASRTKPYHCKARLHHWLLVSVTRRNACSFAPHGASVIATSVYKLFVASRTKPYHCKARLHHWLLVSVTRRNACSYASHSASVIATSVYNCSLRLALSRIIARPGYTIGYCASVIAMHQAHLSLPIGLQLFVASRTKPYHCKASHHWLLVVLLMFVSVTRRNACSFAPHGASVIATSVYNCSLRLALSRIIARPGYTIGYWLALHVAMHVHLHRTAHLSLPHRSTIVRCRICHCHIGLQLFVASRTKPYHCKARLHHWLLVSVTRRNACSYASHSASSLPHRSTIVVASRTKPYHCKARLHHWLLVSVTRRNACSFASHGASVIATSVYNCSLRLALSRIIARPGYTIGYWLALHVAMHVHMHHIAHLSLPHRSTIVRCVSH
ncbi:hypothetical protein J6590_061088 [Homalodisca vitripennis]|nr:hypothetical protein J6590_061088 [Homalodisca vitripennis]